MQRRRVLLPLLGSDVACGPAAAPASPERTGPDLRALFPEPSATSPSDGDAAARASATSSAAPAPAEAPCRSDDDCGYDPRGGHCGTDPRWNKQPPLWDQGLICYCQREESACALLRVEPAPCEGDTSCAVRTDPRPHPVRATADRPHEKLAFCRPPRGAEPRRTELFTTCERTNICTMHARECAGGARP